MKADRIEDPETGKAAKVPGAWTGVLKASPVAVTVKGKSPSEMPGSIRVRGRILDESGKAIRGAKVWLQRGVTSRHGHFGWPNMDRRTSDREGRVAFACVPPESKALRLRSEHPQYAGAESVVHLDTAKSDYEAEVRMAAGSTVRGCVKDGAGRPVAGVRVSDNEKVAYTDADGRFELRGVANSCLYAGRRGFVAAGRIPIVQGGPAGCTIVLHRKTKMTISGVVTFTSGEEMSKGKLQFFRDGTGGQHDCIEAKVGERGRFKAIMRKPQPFTGTVWLDRRWHAAVKGIGPGGRDLSLAFEDGGSLRAEVEPAGPLPESLKLQVDCEMRWPPSKQWVRVASETLTAAGGSARFNRLAEGQYRVSVKVPSLRSWTWHKEATVSRDPSGPGPFLSFLLPEMHFGHARIRVVEPDGKTPARKTALWFNGVGASDPSRLKDGYAEIRDIPVGPLSIQIRPWQRYPHFLVRGVVREGEMTDFGTVVIKAEEQAVGTVEGKLLLADGQPATGAVLIGDFFESSPVKADGRFQMRLPAGKSLLEFGISRLRVPVGTAYRGPRRTLLAETTVQAGKAVSADIRLPEMSNTVRIRWEGKLPEKMSWGLSVHRDRLHIYLADDHVWLGHGLPPIGKVPAGDRFLWVCADGYWAWKKVTPASGDATVVFDPRDCGTITGRALRPTGEPAPRAGVALAIPDAPSLDRVERLTGTYGVHGSSTLTRALTASDGSFRFERIGTGRYTVRAGADDVSTVVTVDVKRGKESFVKLVTTATSQAPPPLREPRSGRR